MSWQLCQNLCFLNPFCHFWVRTSQLVYLLLIWFDLLMQQRAQGSVFDPAECNVVKMENRFRDSWSSERSLYVEEILEAQSIFIWQDWQRVKLTPGLQLRSGQTRLQIPLSWRIYWQRWWFFTTLVSWLGFSLVSCGWDNFLFHP